MKEINVRENNGRLMIRFTHEGITYSMTRGDVNSKRDRAIMNKIVAEITIAIENGTFKGIDEWKEKKSVINKSVIIDLLKEQKSQFSRSIISHVENYRGEIRNQSEAKKFFDSLDVKTPTKRRYASELKKLKGMSGIFSLKFKTPKGEKKKEKDPFTEDEKNKILNEFRDSHYAAFVLFLWFTGCRPGEAMALQWKHVEFENSRIYFTQAAVRKAILEERIKDRTKTGNSRFFPMTDRIKYTLLDVKNQRGDVAPDDFVFVTPDGELMQDDTFRNGVWRPALERAEVRARPPYTLRHTFISYQLSKGTSVVKVASWVGNTPKVIWENYAKDIDDGKLPVAD